MGCTPSIHVNQSGVVYCKGSEESPTEQVAVQNQLTGVQGNFRVTEEAGESTSQEAGTLAIQNEPSPFEEEIFKGSMYFQKRDQIDEKEEPTLKFGPMCLKLSAVKILLVFAKDDAQSDALKWAAERLHCDCTIVYTPEAAMEAFENIHPHVVIIDSRQSKFFDPVALCRSIHKIKGSQYVCIVAVVKRNVADKEDGSIVSYLKSGFTRWFVENHSPGVCLNEITQLHHTDLSSFTKLRASQAIFSALDNCSNGIIITGLDHNIQYANKASEKLLGYEAKDLIGKNAESLCRAESVKADITESINMQVKKGKEWEGILFHKRKSGDNIPLWSRILPVETYAGQADYLIHVNETHQNTDKPFVTDPADMLPYVKSTRKTSVDVRSLCGETGLNRRQSFAKFHAMTLEPPITKVINMILATQEHSPLFVVQALDRVLDILRGADIYSPQFTGLHHNRVDDQVASDLFSGLISNSKQVIRRFSHEAFRGIPGTQPPPLTPSALPNLGSAPPKVKEVLDNISEWHFDIFQLERITEKRPLIWAGMAIFARFNACSILNCDETTLRNWLSLIESNYHSNPYHNSTHAADVLQATAYFLEKPRLKAIFDPMDEIISLIAAVAHDIDHPGRNSAFLCNTGNDLAILYNDLSVLESHHSALAFKLTMSSEKVNIFQHLNKDAYKEVRRSIIDMILATEMTKHFEHLSKFVNVFTKSVEAEEDLQSTSNYSEEVQSSELDPSSPDLSAMSTPENVVLVKRILIKCADVSNPCRPLNLCKEWAYRIAEEYISQTDEEKSKNLPIVMPAFDRVKCSIPKSQMGFTEYFVNDMFDAWDAFSDVPELIDHIKENYEFWKEQQALREKQKDSIEKENPTS